MENLSELVKWNQLSSPQWSRNEDLPAPWMAVMATPPPLNGCDSHTISYVWLWWSHHLLWMTLMVTPPPVNLLWWLHHLMWMTVLVTTSCLSTAHYCLSPHSATEYRVLYQKTWTVLSVAFHICSTSLLPFSCAVDAEILALVWVVRTGENVVISLALNNIRAN